MLIGHPSGNAQKCRDPVNFEQSAVAQLPLFLAGSCILAMRFVFTTLCRKQPSSKAFAARVILSSFAASGEVLGRAATGGHEVPFVAPGAAKNASGGRPLPNWSIFGMCKCIGL